MKAAQLIQELKLRVQTLDEAILTFERLQHVRSWREDLAADSAALLGPRKRGRPLGSKNKPKAYSVLTVEEISNPYLQSSPFGDDHVTSDLKVHERRIIDHFLCSDQFQTARPEEA